MFLRLIGGKEEEYLFVLTSGIVRPITGGSPRRCRNIFWHFGRAEFLGDKAIESARALRASRAAFMTRVIFFAGVTNWLDLRPRYRSNRSQPVLRAQESSATPRLGHLLHENSQTPRYLPHSKRVCLETLRVPLYSDDGLTGGGRRLCSRIFLAPVEFQQSPV